MEKRPQCAIISNIVYQREIILGMGLRIRRVGREKRICIFFDTDSYLLRYSLVSARNLMDLSIFQTKGHELAPPHTPTIDAKVFLGNEGAKI